MEILYKFAIDVFAQMAANKLSSVYERLVGIIWKNTKEAKAIEIQKLLELTCPQIMYQAV